MGKSQNNVTIKDAIQYTQDDQHLQVAQKIVAKNASKNQCFPGTRALQACSTRLLSSP
jgi:hypothetical protein